MSKYPSKYSLIPKVIQYCLSSDLFRELDARMAMADLGEKTEEEFKLTYTAEHEKFVSAFEKRLEDYLKSQGSTSEKFYEMCSDAQKAGDDNIEAFVTILTQMLEFQTYVDLCRDPEKRKHVKQILGLYSKMLTQ